MLAIYSHETFLIVSIFIFNYFLTSILESVQSAQNRFWHAMIYY